MESAARAFHFDFNGKTVLDIGSSTGGFTKYALDHGAKKVIAIEKGTNQMLPAITHDPRVDLHEKTDIFVSEIGINTFEGNPQLLRGLSDEPREDGREERPEKVFIPIPDTILADVSFVSLRRVLAHARDHLAGKDTEFLVMLKPQFEAAAKDLHNGIVKNESIRRRIIKDFELWLKQNHFLIIKKHDNELKGAHGNQERFYYLKLAK